MTSSQNISTSESNRIEEPTRRRRIGRVIFDGFCLTLLVVGLGYIGWFGISATRSVSRSLAGPETMVRLQIVNATPDVSLGKAVAGILEKSLDAQMSFAVVDTAKFGARRVTHSFLVARDNNASIAESIAARLGMDKSRVTVLPLEHNTRNISVTLVLGEDYRSLSLSQGIGKETTRKT